MELGYTSILLLGSQVEVAHAECEVGAHPALRACANMPSTWLAAALSALMVPPQCHLPWLAGSRSAGATMKFSNKQQELRRMYELAQQGKTPEVAPKAKAKAKPKADKATAPLSRSELFDVMKKMQEGQPTDARPPPGRQWAGVKQPAAAKQQQAVPRAERAQPSYSDFQQLLKGGGRSARSSGRSRSDDLLPRGSLLPVPTSLASLDGIPCSCERARPEETHPCPEDGRADHCPPYLGTLGVPSRIA